MLSEVITIAAVFLARIGLQQSGVGVAEKWLAELLLFGCVMYVFGSNVFRGIRLEREALARGGWWGGDGWLLHILTMMSLGGALALAGWAWLCADAGQKLGSHGAVLVLDVVVLMAIKLVTETTLYARLGGDPSPRQESAKRLIGPLAGWAKLRYTLGALGGIVFPLAAQLLAGGGKNIPPTVAAGPSAVLAALALACLVPGELLERWLFWRAQEGGHEKAQETPEGV